LKEEESEDFQKRSTFYASFVQKGALCFDVGANLGNRVGPLLSAGARVVAVEPQENCYKALRNKFGTKIDIVTKGLGAEPGIKDFYISNAHTISSFSEEFVEVVKDGRFKEYNWNKTIKVEITTLDALVEKYGTPAFIKIDVEGYELEVLKGLSSPIDMISVEYMVPEQAAKVVECIEQIEKNNPTIECNFSVGESMEFGLEAWLSATEMKDYVLGPGFISTEFGDVYCRKRNV
jgi:FkbM family methyltransferase